MNTSFELNQPSRLRTRGTLLRSLSLAALVSGLSLSVWAQAPATPDAAPADAGNGNGNGRMRRGQGGQNGGNFDPAQMQQQMLDRLREQLGVTDDAEWAVISDRATKVGELRRTVGGGGGMGRGGFAGGGGGNRPNRAGATANPELDALRAAVTDKLPDAEVKARLDRFREVRKQNEEKLTKAQEDLRAVLSVRQEAVAVMYGLLP